MNKNSRLFHVYMEAVRLLRTARFECIAPAKAGAQPHKAAWAEPHKAAWASKLERFHQKMNRSSLAANTFHSALFTLIAISSFGIFEVQAQTQNGGKNTPKPPFSSTADTVFDIIQVSDPSTFICLQYIGRGERQIWDKRVNGEPVVNAFLFKSRYSDGNVIEIALNPEFESKENARKEALRYANPLGQLPTVLRKGVKRFSIHKGRKGYHAGTGQIVVYAATTDNRLGYDHLEESLFHESVHASWDAEHRLSANWIKAQKSDNQFLTAYGQKSPEREDLAETALFAYAILHYPDRFPPADSADTKRAVPNRIEYIRNLLPPGSPIFLKDENTQKCAEDAAN